ncbi:cryptochrome/photolyase family protein [Pseudomonas sp. CCI3.2]|uniref:cryptochrome/photolyase family protein n=1 Tax=unclassified Pseudomonas TaxID=196821 RepID=UPI002AC97B1D|nr:MULTISPECIES: cryptochrome/photolyase family protein [unclassified Pseudomonas]MEB0075971.1 cryptochrome/photolyase family protein [Pseudomonas sp. MH10out]MEB0101416.1 cryptochrome/photolyase family protein [Pseudomonas sp. CCI3.2]MEB0130950.1 cryptochrome/photolyase family protein [Pseudomonas sp. CCI2.4]MEB0157928.1 cryptochrome/photolyase family protein [Pseudomonas sp. AH2 (2023)]MEB0166367.1 cryptochrome/photolyase family protein [Pseudomonas sp. CCC4.4]
MTHLRLILGDQLNPCHSWFQETQGDVIYLMMEIRQETDYVLHHAQKILAIFAGMREFARGLREAGHRVHYLCIDDPQNRQSLPGNLDHLLGALQVNRFEYQAPDEWRLDAQLAEYCAGQSRPWCEVDSEHFYSARDAAAQQFAGRKQWLMEHFYRHMRVTHQVLMDANNRPSGGQWNYDHDNRKRWPGTPFEPEDMRVRHDHSALWASIVAAGVGSFGQPNAERLAWPLNRAEALVQLDDFIEMALPHFGDFQDAMSSHAWRLFHSLLSFALNTKMLNPREVVGKAEAAYRAGLAPLAATEGFIRQILGWREYVRGVYWAQMPGYESLNALGHSQPLPSWFWDGKTRMRCLAHAIGSSLENAHAHHIQRLMVIGNFALLAGLDPQEVHRWYLGVYIDAFEWVELPNTLGMSQFADGGLLATKPYVSSAAYIDRMSDYCKGCHYDKKARLGERACPYNALYWDFFQRNKTQLEGNPRLSMVYRQLSIMDGGAVTALQERALTLRASLDSL